MSRKPQPKSEPVSQTLNQRHASHGSFVDNGVIMQCLKTTMRERGGNWVGLLAYQKEALDMIQHKIGRILSGDPNFIDHWHDIAGYATLVEDILRGNDR